MIDNHSLKTVEKFNKTAERYKKFLYQKVAELSVECSVIPAPENDPERLAAFSVKMPESGWNPIRTGERWGGEYCYGWFRAAFTVPEALAGKSLLILPDVGGAEGLLFLNGKPAGMFDVCHDLYTNLPRLHDIQPLTDSAVAGESFDIVIESYAGHSLCGAMPWESYENREDTFYPKDSVRPFSGIGIVTYDALISELLIHTRILSELIATSDQSGSEYARAVSVACDAFRYLPQLPEDTYDAGQISRAVEIMKTVTADFGAEGDKTAYVGLVGHSHLDTAWQWPVRETLHKAARTFSNALRVMDYYPNYRFIQSSVVYIDWMKKYYPDIYEGIRKRTAEGRWEPNGGSWVECDNNITGGEYIIRHFLRGQNYLKENLNYQADVFWQPDTFGYSAALPQILKGCGIRYFLTTKLYCNEANSFPYDTFIWKGIDGSEVLTHFNVIHCLPSVADVRGLALPTIKNRDVSDWKLMSYGYGDGGGGVSYSGQELTEHIVGLNGMPKMEFTTVSSFMNRLEKTAKNPPAFSGELYLELHRGTLTQAHEIKRSNRVLEKEIRSREMIDVLCGVADDAVCRESIDTLLLNQFHDILPGTSLKQVHDVAIYQNDHATDLLRQGSKAMLGGKTQGWTLFNTLSWDRTAAFAVKDNGLIPGGCTVQKYTDLDGEAMLAVGGIDIPAFGTKELTVGIPKEEECPFTVDGDKIRTPFADIVLRDGAIVSYRDKNGFEAVNPAGNPFNTFYCGEDIPAIWDNWDIDYDQLNDMQPTPKAESCTLVSCGALQLRFRVCRKIGLHSSMIQDIVFYADTPRIDFVTKLDWQEKHQLLKVGFNTVVQSDFARFEAQFGHLKRPTHDNYGTDKAKFEVCNHKWSDLSDNRYGVAILNDCKYGISVKGSDMRLSLHRGGCHPDPTGDAGVHEFTYSLLVHECGFSTESVIRPAYEMNYPVFVADGSGAIGARQLLSLSADNVIVETVKPAEDGNGVILRLYETEGCHAAAELNIEKIGKNTWVTDMLEQKQKELSVQNGSIMLSFTPFEIKTVKIE